MLKLGKLLARAIAGTKTQEPKPLASPTFVINDPRECPSLNGQTPALPEKAGHPFAVFITANTAGFVELVGLNIDSRALNEGIKTGNHMRSSHISGNPVAPDKSNERLVPLSREQAATMIKEWTTKARTAGLQEIINYCYPATEDVPTTPKPQRPTVAKVA